jgi:hypothetical protein
VWIDSVCIDQQNIPEREHQVRLMGEIYSKASLVSVLLILQPDMARFHSEVTRVFGKELAAKLLPDDKNFSPSSVQGSFFELGKYFSAAAAADIIEDLRLSLLSNSSDFSIYENFSAQRWSFRIYCLRQFLSNAWWERIWVVQEVALGKRVRIIYGDVEIPWSYIDDAISLAHRSRLLRPLM